jgi:hypothetical protein
MKLRKPVHCARQQIRRMVIAGLSNSLSVTSVGFSVIEAEISAVIDDFDTLSQPLPRFSLTDTIGSSKKNHIDILRSLGIAGVKDREVTEPLEMRVKIADWLSHIRLINKGYQFSGRMAN